AGALWVALAAHEDAATAEFVFHRTAADRAGEFRWHISKSSCFREFIFRAYGFLKRPIKCSKGFFVSAFTARDFVELIFHFCSEGVTDVMREILFEPPGDHHAGRSRSQGAAGFLDIATILDRFHGAR